MGEVGKLGGSYVVKYCMLNWLIIYSLFIRERGKENEREIESVFKFFYYFKWGKERFLEMRLIDLLFFNLYGVFGL